MTAYQLDSDAIIDYFKGFALTVELLRRLYAQRDTLCTCDVAVAEVYTGLAPGERDRAGELLSTLTFPPTSAAAARQGGIWRYDYARRGMQLPTTDCLIAAIGHEYGATIITGNVADYPMPELNLLPLPRPSGPRRREP